MPSSFQSDRWYSAHVEFARSVMGGCAWTLIGTSAAVAGTLVAAVIAARLLGREAFGVYGAVLVTAVTLTNLASAGLGISTTYFLAQTAADDPQRAGRLAGMFSSITLATATTLSLGLALSSTALSSFLFGGTDFAGPLRWAAPYVFFMTVNAYQVGALTGLAAYRGIAWSGLAQAFILPISMYGWVKMFGLPGSVASLNCAAVSVCVVQAMFLRYELRAQGISMVYSGFGEESRVVWRFLCPAACSGILSNLGIWAAGAVLLRIGGVSEFALFAAANSVRNLILFAPAVVNKVAIPVFARMRGDSSTDFRAAFWSNAQQNGVFALLTAALMAAFGESILGIFGKRFHPSPIFHLLLAASCVEVIATALFQVLLSRGAIWTNVAVVMLWSSVLIGMATFFIDRMGGAGLALGYLVAWMACAVVYAWLAARFFGKSRRETAREHQLCSH